MVSEEELKNAAAILRAGGLVVFPTETVYGLGGSALDASAIHRIYEAKRRPSTSPLIVHVESVERARELLSAWPEQAECLARQFWPGPLTIVLRKNGRIPDEVTAGLPTVGIRMPAHPVALALIRASDLPLAAPSANRFTELSPTTAEHVRRGLGPKVDMVLDAGPTAVGIESTVVSLADPSRPELLRPGAISRSQIEALLGPLQTVSANAGPHAAPGMHARHYSPHTPLQISDNLPGGRIAFLWWNRAQSASKSVRMPSTAVEYAACLYAKLHELDQESWDALVVEPVPETDEWAGVRDRLSRAAFR